jgi:hypothetical protein
VFRRSVVVVNHLLIIIIKGRVFVVVVGVLYE